MSLIRKIALGFGLVLSILVFSKLSPASSVGNYGDLNKSNTILIQGSIGRNILGLQGPLLKLAKTASEVNLIIDSPGGSVVAGFMFVNTMEEVRAQGLKINCFVPRMAASMAFQILLHCDKRVVLDKSFLLWHRARVFTDSGSPVTAPQALALARDLDRIDQLIYQEVAEYVDMDEELLEYHFEHETLHVGESLKQSTDKFLDASHSSIPGILEMILRDGQKTDKFVRMSDDSPFGEYVLPTSTSEIQYIAPNDILTKLGN